MNFVTAKINTSVTKYGSCGYESFTMMNDGPYLNLKGTFKANGLTCDAYAVLDQDINNSNLIMESDFVQTLYRPFEHEHLNKMKLGETLVYQAGFKIWDSATSEQIKFQGASVQKSWVVSDAASNL